MDAFFKPVRRQSESWDSIRGFSMVTMTAIHLPLALGWSPGGLILFKILWPLMEPIFFLSGFLIVRRAHTQLFIEKDGLGETMRRYAGRRILRTWPLYYLFVIAFFLLPWINPLPSEPIDKSLLAYFTFTMNENARVNGLSHLWSLCVEEWCYLLVLLLFPLLQKGRAQIAFFSFGPKFPPWPYLSLA